MSGTHVSRIEPNPLGGHYAVCENCRGTIAGDLRAVIEWCDTHGQDAAQ